MSDFRPRRGPTRAAVLVAVAVAVMSSVVPATTSRPASAVAPRLNHTGTPFSAAPYATVTVSSLRPVHAPRPTSETFGQRATGARSTGAAAPIAPTRGAVSRAPKAPFGPLTATDIEANVVVAGLGQNGATPPDVALARGGNRVVEEINLDGRVLDETGATKKSFTLAAFWMRGGDGLSDPKIVFDDASQRFYSTILDVTANSVLLAVSTTSDPTGTWTLYVIATRPTGRFADQPRLGFGTDKVIVAYEDFDVDGGCFPGSSCSDDRMIAVQKSDLLAAATARGVEWNLTNGAAHPFGVTPAVPIPGQDKTAAYAAYNETNLTGHRVGVFIITGTPAVGDTDYVEHLANMANSTAPPPAGHQPGNLQNIDTGDDRFQSVSQTTALAGLGVDLWVAGNTKCSPGGTDQSCLRFERVAVNSTATNVTRTWEHTLSAVGQDLYYPAIVGQPGGNHVFVAFTRSSNSIFPRAEIVSFTANGGATLAKPTFSVMASGTQAVTCCADPKHSNRQRWGDYHTIVADDATGTTVWAGAEFGGAGGDFFGTAVGQFTLDIPTVTAINPSSGPPGTTVTIDGNGFTSASAVAFGNAAATSVTFKSRRQLVAVAPPHVAGLVDVTVTTMKGTSDASAATKYRYPAIVWTSMNGSNTVTAFDSITRTEISPSIPVFTPPTAIAATSDGRWVLVAGSGTSVYLLDASAHTFDATIGMGATPHDIALSPDGTRAYVTLASGAIRPIDLTGATPAALAPVPVSGSGSLDSIAVTPDNRFGIVTDSVAGGVWRVDLTGSLPAQFATFDSPRAVAVNGTSAWVTLSPGPLTAGLLLELDSSTLAVRDAKSVGLDPRAVTTTPTGDYVYVSNYGSASVTPVQHFAPGTNGVLAAIGVAPQPLGITTDPTGTEGYVALLGAPPPAQDGVFPSPPGPAAPIPLTGTTAYDVALAQPVPPGPCGPSGVQTKINTTVQPSPIARGAVLTELDRVGVCQILGAPTLTLTVTQRFLKPNGGIGCIIPKPRTSDWIVTVGDNLLVTQRTGPDGCAGNWRVKISAKIKGTSTVVASTTKLFVVT